MKMNCFPFGFRSLAGVLLTILCCCCTAKPSEKEHALLKSLDETIAASTSKIAQNSELILASLENKRYEPATHYKAELWYPKALLVQKHSSGLAACIKELKGQLSQRAASARENDEEVVSRLFVKEGKAKQLQEQCKQYGERILRIDTNLKREMEQILTGPGGFTLNTALPESDASAPFSQTTPVEAQAWLTQLENRVAVTENRLLGLIHDQFTTHRICTFISPIVAQSSSSVRAGQEIEITAAVGALTAPVGLKITIDGKSVPLAEDVAAHYIFRASKKAGKHTVPVTIEYIDQDGKVMKAAKNMEYTVIKE